MVFFSGIRLGACQRRYLATGDYVTGVISAIWLFQGYSAAVTLLPQLYPGQQKSLFPPNRGSQNSQTLQHICHFGNLGCWECWGTNQKRDWDQSKFQIWLGSWDDLLYLLDPKWSETVLEPKSYVLSYRILCLWFVVLWTSWEEANAHDMPVWLLGALARNRVLTDQRD